MKSLWLRWHDNADMSYDMKKTSSIPRFRTINREKLFRVLVLALVFVPEAVCLVGRPYQHHFTNTLQQSFLSYLATARRKQNRRDISPSRIKAASELEYRGADEELYDGEEGEEDDDDFGPSQDYGQRSLLEIYARDRKWLEKATGMILDHPIGELTEDDIDNITALMDAWVHRRSVEGALVVERLLKRVVDDMHAKNQDIQVTAEMYALAMDAWAKCDAEGAAERAQHIHDVMAQIYDETRDPTMQPTSATYNILISAHGKRADPQGLEQAEQLLNDMINSADNATMPDTSTFNLLLEAYSKSNDTRRAVERAPELMDMMDDLKVKQNAHTFTALQNIYATSGQPDAPERALQVLQSMLAFYAKGNAMARPSISNYNAVLTALSRTNTRQSAEMAEVMLQRMETEDCWDVRPDRLSYSLAILACARCPDQFGVQKAEELLLKMEARAQEDDKKRKEVSSAAPASVVLDAECFNVVLTALSKSREHDAVQRSLAIMERMKKYAADGHDDIMPTIRAWNALLNSLSRSKDESAGVKAEKIVKHMYDLHRKGYANVKPNAFSFTAVLHAFQLSRDPEHVHRADHILRWMERLYEEGDLDTPPDVFHYTICCNVWAKSNLPIAPRRVMEILGHMTLRSKQGFPKAKPNSRTYRSVLNCLATKGRPGEAEALLDNLIRLDMQGESYLTEFTFNSLISSFCRNRRKGSGARAEAVLEKMLAFAEHNPSCRPDTRSFTNIILHHKISTLPDAPYRAEYLLNRLIGLFKSGDHPELMPDNFAFEAAMNAYSSAKHPDSGVQAERLLTQLKDLRDNYGVKRLVLDRNMMHTVLFAWSVSGDEDAGRRAEHHLGYMERKYAAGDEGLKPDTRCYGLVLSAWSKSSSFEKARRALAVLKRMEEQQQNGNNEVHPSSIAYSHVINACAFTKSTPEVEEEAFHIAVNIFNKMLESKNCQPSSVTYGWFLQACSRLHAPPDAKDEQIERAWKLCCKNGLVNAMVIQRLTGAASESQYRRMMQPVLKKLQNNMGSKEELKYRISPAILPSEWTRNCMPGDEETSRPEWWGR